MAPLSSEKIFIFGGMGECKALGDGFILSVSSELKLEPVIEGSDSECFYTAANQCQPLGRL